MAEDKVVEVVLLSGGMDSTTLLYQTMKNASYYKAKERVVVAMGCNYGQRHIRELSMAQATCKKLGVQYQIVDLTQLKPLLAGSVLTGKGDVPEGMYDAASMAATVVPNRNMIMISIAAGWAESLRAGMGFDLGRVFTAVHAGDHAIYPDCRPMFTQSVSLTTAAATDGKVAVFAPFVDISKTDIWALGCELNVDWQYTHTCYKGASVHCGVCGTCVERIESVIQADTGPDEVMYDPKGWRTGVALLHKEGKIEGPDWGHYFRFAETR